MAAETRDFLRETPQQVEGFGRCLVKAFVDGLYGFFVGHRLGLLFGFFLAGGVALDHTVDVFTFLRNRDKVKDDLSVVVVVTEIIEKHGSIEGIVFAGNVETETVVVADCAVDKIKLPFLVLGELDAALGGQLHLFGRDGRETKLTGGLYGCLELDIVILCGQYFEFHDLLVWDFRLQNYEIFPNTRQFPYKIFAKSQFNDMNQ